MAAITADSRWLVFLIKPWFKDSRDARIHKKNPEASLKDTMAWIELGTDVLTKVPRIKSFRVPEKEGAWLAYLLEKPQGDSMAKKQSDSSGTDLVLRNLAAAGGGAAERRFALACEYLFSKNGNTLIIETTRRGADSTSKALIPCVNTGNDKVHTVLPPFHDALNYALDEAAPQTPLLSQNDIALNAIVNPH